MIKKSVRYPGIDLHGDYQDPFFGGTETRALQIPFFGKLKLPVGVSRLETPLQFSARAGGNNASEEVVLPAGALVAYYTTPGIWENVLFADRFPTAV
jgi:hypothetical protein